MLPLNPTLIHEVALTGTGTAMRATDAMRLAQLSYERSVMNSPVKQAHEQGAARHLSKAVGSLNIEKGLRYAAHYASMILG